MAEAAQLEEAQDMSRTSGSGCDHDFNDVVYRLNVSPITAFTNRDSVYHETVPDFDKDGVPDAMDEFPNDSQRATTRSCSEPVLLQPLRYTCRVITKANSVILLPFGSYLRRKVLCAK